MSRLTALVCLVPLLTSCTGGGEKDGPDYTPVPDAKLFAQVEQIDGVVSADLSWSDKFGRSNTYDGVIRTRGVSACEVLDRTYAILWQGRPDADLVIEVEQRKAPPSDLSEFDVVDMRAIDRAVERDPATRYGEQPGTGKPPDDSLCAGH
jgi:hypothetical protein